MTTPMFLRKPTFLVLLLFALVIIFLNLPGEPLIQPLRTRLIDSFILSLYRPAQLTVLKASDSVKEIWKNYFVLVGIKKENEKLRQDLALKDLRLVSLEEKLKVQETEESLNQQLKRFGLDGVLARVIAYDPLAQVQAVWIDRGSRADIRIDQPVMTLEGLVGRVIKVFDLSAQVLLLVDSHFAVDVLDSETRFRALAGGSGGKVRLTRYPLLTHLEFRRLGDEIRPGDLLVTSGMNGIYPPGIPVGTVMKPVKDEEGIVLSSLVLPRVDFAKLEEVMVIMGPASKE